MSAFQRAVLSVNPDRLEQFTKKMKKNISDKNSKKKVSRRHRSPSESSSRKSKVRKKHSNHDRESMSKLSSKSTKLTDSTARLPLKSVKKQSSRRHKPSLAPMEKKVKDDSDFDPNDLNLSRPLFSLTSLVKDRKALLETAFSIIHGPKFTAMLPNSLKLMPLEEIKQLCDQHLTVMSSKRIVHVLAGMKMDSSSGTDSSDDDKPSNSKNQHDVASQEPTVQTNLVDSTTSDTAGPCMLFPSAIHTAQCSMAEASTSGIELDGVSTSIGPTSAVVSHGVCGNSEAEDGELEPFVSSEEEISQHHNSTAKVLNDLSGEADEIFVEEVEEIEEATEVQIHQDTEQNFEGKQSPQLLDDSKSIDYSGKTQLEILELELRARAIRSLMKAAKAGTLNKYKALQNIKSGATES